MAPGETSPDHPRTSHEITLLLQRWGGGDKQALDELLPLLFEDLRGVARSYLANEDKGHTLQATALVNEIYLRLAGEVKRLQFLNREHFFRTATRMMRRLLTDHARQRTALKRGQGYKHTLEEGTFATSLSESDPETLLALDQALERLAERHPRLTRLIELRIYLGFDIDATARALEVSRNTVKRDWDQAKKRLFLELNR